MAAEGHHAQTFSLRQWLDMHLNDLSTGATRYINMFFIGMIMVSVLCTMLLTVPDMSDAQKYILHKLEIIFAFTFLGEYLLRLYAAPSRLKYIFSLYGIVDLCAIVPALAGFNQSLAIRMLRMIAIIRLLKLMRYARDVQVLLISLRESIGILFGVAAAILLMAVFMGNVVYAIEPANFSTAFEGLWWSLVTMSTVGYGDYVPHSLAGRIVAGICMLMGIGMFAIITGIIAAKIQHTMQNKDEAPCLHCSNTISAMYLYCPHCGQYDPHVSQVQPAERPKGRVKRAIGSRHAGKIVSRS